MSPIKGIDMLPLSEDPETLGKSCICRINGKRCTRRRARSDDNTYDSLLDDLTTHWGGLDEKEQQATAFRFAEHSVCSQHWKEDVHYLIRDMLLAEKAELVARSPSYSSSDRSPTSLASQLSNSQETGVDEPSRRSEEESVKSDGDTSQELNDDRGKSVCAVS